MKRILVFLEEADGQLLPCAAPLMRLAREAADGLQAQVIALVLSVDTARSSAEASRLGADLVVRMEHPALSGHNALAYAAALCQAAASCRTDFVFLSHTLLGSELSARAAVRLGASLYTGCTDVRIEEHQAIFSVPAYRRDLRALYRAPESMVVATFEPREWKTQNLQHPACPVRQEMFVYSGERLLVLSEERMPEPLPLSEAPVIISGGRGMKSSESFSSLYELADVLGGAVGASRAAVDCGWAEPAQQIGYSGTAASPRLYIACGISGAMQHIEGMESADYVLSINHSAEAPFTEAADLSVAGDAPAIVRLLTEALRGKQAKTPPVD